MTVQEVKYCNGWLGLRTNNPDMNLLETFTPGEYEIKKVKQKRTKKANDYMWALCSEIADALGDPKTTKDDIYKDAIKQMTVYKDFHDMTADEAKTFRYAWEHLGNGWVTEEDYEPDGEHKTVRAYYGSSQYSGKQMSRLINLLLEDARSIGLVTPDEDYIRKLIDEHEKSVGR